MIAPAAEPFFGLRCRKIRLNKKIATIHPGKSQRAICDRAEYKKPKGASVVHRARLLQQKAIPGHSLWVDTWLGSLEMWLRKDDPDFYAELQLQHGYPTVYEQFLANVKHSSLQEMITPLPQTSLIAARWLQTHQLIADLIYIDTSHDKIKPG